MKKYHITAFIAGAMIIAGLIFSHFTRDYWLGILSGIGIFLGLTATFGQWLAAKAAERMDKLRRDNLEQVVNED